MRARVRLVTLLGLLVAVAGLAGYWLTRDVQRGALSEDQRRLLGIAADEFHASFVVAGRDIAVTYDRSDPIYAQDGTILLVMMYAKNERENVAAGDIQRVV